MAKRAKGVYLTPPGGPGDGNASFARILNSKMLAKGWGQKDLVAAMNNLRHPDVPAIHRAIVSNYIRGICMPRAGKLDLIARALGCEITELVQTTDDVKLLGADAAVPTKMEVLPSGNAHLAFDRELPMDAALRILAILNELRA